MTELFFAESSEAFDPLEYDPFKEYDPDFFLEAYRAWGFDMTFNDQHENILCILIGIILIFIARDLFKNIVTIRSTKIAGGAIIATALLNMALGVPFDKFDKYEFIFLIAIIGICLILTLEFRKKYGSGKLFIIPILYAGAMMYSYAFTAVDYKICNKLQQYPPEYGLQWRPFYQGFTDNAYFKSLEKKVKSDDSTKILYDLLTEEPHSFNFPFNILKQEGWQIIEVKNDIRIFINPDKTMGYIQTHDEGGLVPPQNITYEFKECFPQASMANIIGVNCDALMVLTTEENDTTKLYLNSAWHGGIFYNVKDSILSLPDSEITNITHKIDEAYYLNKDIYETSKVLSFPKDTIKQIQYGKRIIRVQFKNPNAKDKVYNNDPNNFFDVNDETGTAKLHRY